MRKLVLPLVFILVCSAIAYAKIDYPYGEFNIKMPPLEEPYPGIGSYYSTVAKGVGTVMWNPASLMKIGTVDVSLSMNGAQEIRKFNKTMNLQDATFEALDISGGTNNFTGGVFYDIPANITGTQKQTREVQGRYSYLTESTGITYQTALKINEWLSAGIIYRGPVESNLNMVGDFPTTLKYSLSMVGATVEGSPMWLTGDKLNYVIPETTITSQTAGSVWGGFLTQEAQVPLTSYSYFRNKVNVNSSLTASIAGEYKKLSFGANFTPIAAEMNFDNSIRTIVNAGTSNVAIYQPNFTTSTEAFNWFNNSSLYGTSTGYRAVNSTVPAGQAVVDGKYRGFYDASAIRMDLGAMYDFTDNFRVGIAFENFNAAALNFSGSGRVTYAQTRMGTAEFGSGLDPAKGTPPSLFTDTFSSVKGTENYSLEPQKNYPLPQKMRIGFAFVKPKLIAVDYETQTNPIKCRMQDSTGIYTDMTVSGINMFRIGMDLDFLKFGTTLLLKPTVTGVDSATQANINKAFKYVVLPVKVDLGTALNLWGWRNDWWMGLNALSIFDILQFNTLNADLSKLLYYGFSFTKSYWTFGYQANLDPFATAAAYYSAKETNPNKQVGWGDIKWVNTLQATYRF